MHDNDPLDISDSQTVKLHHQDCQRVSQNLGTRRLWDYGCVRLEKIWRLPRSYPERRRSQHYKWLVIIRPIRKYYRLQKPVNLRQLQKTYHGICCQEEPHLCWQNKWPAKQKSSISCQSRFRNLRQKQTVL